MTYVHELNLAYSAFPEMLHNEVKKSIAYFPDIEIFKENPIEAIVDKEQLHIPARFYLKGGCTTNAYNVIQLCILSRSTDGLIREDALKTLLTHNVPKWAIPYAFIALGDYCLRISTLPISATPIIKRALIEFLLDNPEIGKLIEARIISYWNVYHKNKYSSFRDYPPHKFLQSLKID